MPALEKLGPSINVPRTELIRRALRKLGRHAKTRRIQEYVKKYFGICVKQPLVCITRNRFNATPEDRMIEDQTKYLQMVVKAHGGYTPLIKLLEELRDIEENE